MRACDNPFSTSRVHRIRYRSSEWDLTDLIVRLTHHHFRAAIVGPHGSGKTTLMEDLEPGLRGEGFTLHHLRLDESHRRFQPGVMRDLAERVGKSDCLVLDGAEQMHVWEWWWFRRTFRHAGGLLITSHRHGLLPTLVTCETSPRLLAGIISDLVSTTPSKVLPAACNLHRRHAGNIREALRELYDRKGDFDWAAPELVAVEA